MDSGNSSSMQSSSGGCGGDQEEYDSRTDQSISAFFNHNNTNTTISGPTQLDSLISNYFTTGWSTDNPLWSATTTTTNPTDGSCLRPPQPQPPPISSEPIFFTNQRGGVSNTTNTSSPLCSVPTDKRNGLATTSSRNPKKRSRVSRRAPTTVLTTDTSNFRAMVQEFTGNPSTPFTGLSSSSSPFSRSRFDLFGSSSSSSLASRPLKPFPHKLIPQQPTSSSHHHNHHYLFTPPPPSTDYLLNMNTQNITNPFLNSQSPNNPLNNHSLLCEKSKPLMFDQSLSLRTSHDGFGHVDVGTNFDGLHNIVVSSSSALSQPTTLSTMHGDHNASHQPRINDNNGEDQDQSMVQRSNASGQENNLATVRNEGMVELSWISSSD